jgi:hypothetical protein
LTFIETVDYLGHLAGELLADVGMSVQPFKQATKNKEALCHGRKRDSKNEEALVGKWEENY